MDPKKNSLSKNSHTNASSSSLPAGEVDTAGEALVDGESDGTVNGRRKKDGHGQVLRNRAVRDGEDEGSGLSVPAENAVFLPAEGRPRVSMGVEGLSMAKGGKPGAETATADLEFGGGASLKVDHGESSSSSFNLDEFLKLANRVIDQGDEASMAALNDLKIRWKSRFGDGGNLCETPMVARGQERPVIGEILKARHCLLPRIAGQTTVGNGGETSAKLQLPRAAIGCDSSSEMGGNGGFSGRPMSAGGRNVVVPLRVFPASDVDVYVDTAGADVAAEVGDKDGDVDERAADISPTRADVIHDARADVIHDTRADVSNLRANIISFMGEKTATWGKNRHPFPCLLGTFRFTLQNGEVVVRPSLDTVRDGSKRWKSTAVGYFMEVTATANGFFFFQFKMKIDMEEGQLIVLKKWEPGMAMRKLKHTQVTVWIKLRHLPLEFWTTEGLSIVASDVGKPLYPDAITWACTRMDFARVCMMTDVTQKLKKHIIIMTPDEDGGETPCKVDIKYEWLPPKCTGCMTLGHSKKECSLTKPQKQTKPPVKVYVPKANVPPPPAPEEREKKHKTVVVAEDKARADEGTKQNKRYISSQKEKGKEVVVFNPFDALNSLDDVEENTRGPNTYSPSSSDPC
ncbi:UNVERIFIED_CONTAM: hypothetical protein Sindi_1200900 [Sesamum indicum]